MKFALRLWKHAHSQTSCGMFMSIYRFGCCRMNKNYAIDIRAPYAPTIHTIRNEMEHTTRMNRSERKRNAEIFFSNRKFQKRKAKVFLNWFKYVFSSIQTNSADAAGYLIMSSIPLVELSQDTGFIPFSVLKCFVQSKEKIATTTITKQATGEKRMSRWL